MFRTWSVIVIPFNSLVLFFWFLSSFLGLAAVDSGELPRQEIAELFAVRTAWIRRLVQRRCETGSIAPKPRRHCPRPKLDPDTQQQLIVLVRQQPDAPLEELCQRLPVRFSIITVCRALKQPGLQA